MEDYFDLYFFLSHILLIYFRVRSAKSRYSSLQQRSTNPSRASDALQNSQVKSPINSNEFPNYSSNLQSLIQPVHNRAFNKEISTFVPKQNQQNFVHLNPNFNGDPFSIPETRSQFMSRPNQYQDHSKLNDFAPNLSESEYVRNSQLTQRNIQSSTFSINSSNTFSMNKGLLNSRTTRSKSKQERKNKWNLSYIIGGLLLFAFVLVMVFSYRSSSGAYCDSNLQINPEQQCIKCPQNGRCENGELIVNCSIKLNVIY